MSLPHVSSEGGPIILGDFEGLRTWRGVPDDYDNACRLMQQANPSPIVLSGGDAVIWEFGGAGTGEIVAVSDSHLSIVRIWPDESWTIAETEAVIISSATAQFGTAVLAEITITSGYLLALWATEEASKFLPPRGEHGVPGPGLSIGDGGTYIRIPRGCYEITTCEWQTEKFDVTKLDLRMKISKTSGN